MTLIIIKLIFIGIIGILSTGTLATMLNYCVKNGYGDGSLGFTIALLISLGISFFTIYSIGVTF